jgi:hypothetical protein
VIATGGRGRYRDARQVETLKEVVAAELAALTRTVAIGVELRLSGAVIDEVMEHPFERGRARCATRRCGGVS